LQRAIRTISKCSVASDWEPPEARRVSDASEPVNDGAPQLGRRSSNAASKAKSKARRVRTLQVAELQEVQRKKAVREAAVEVVEPTVLTRICKRVNRFCSKLVETARAEHTIIGTMAPMDEEEGLT
jgi:hypothetical protein